MCVYIYLTVYCNRNYMYYIDYNNIYLFKEIEDNVVLLKKKKTTNISKKKFKIIIKKPKAGKTIP